MELVDENTRWSQQMKLVYGASRWSLQMELADETNKWSQQIDYIVDGASRWSQQMKLVDGDSRWSQQMRLVDGACRWSWVRCQIDVRCPGYRMLDLKCLAMERSEDHIELCDFNQCQFSSGMSPQAYCILQLTPILQLGYYKTFQTCDLIGLYIHLQ